MEKFAVWKDKYGVDTVSSQRLKKNVMMGEEEGREESG